MGSSVADRSRMTFRQLIRRVRLTAISHERVLEIEGKELSRLLRSDSVDKNANYVLAEDLRNELLKSGSSGPVPDFIPLLKLAKIDDELNLKTETDAKTEIGFPRSEAEKTISEMIVHGQELSTKYGTDSKKRIIEEGKVKKYSTIGPKKNHIWSEQTQNSMTGYLLMKGLHNVFNVRRFIN